MPSSDYPSLFAPPSAGEPFRQGEILTFDPSDGSNTVRVGGAVLIDLPILVGGDTVNFAPGDAVILLKYRSSWAILGRIVVAGSDELTSAAVDFYAETNSVTGFTMTSSTVAHGEVIIPVPAWANSAIVFATTIATLANGSGSTDTARVYTAIDGTTNQESFQQVPNGDYQNIANAIATVLGVGGSAPLGPTITVQGRFRTNGGTWVGGGIAASVNATATFRRA